MTYRGTIKEETICINRDWVYYLACILSDKTHALSNYFKMIDNILKLIMKRRLSNDSVTN